jgi:16S rRNA (cytosine1402-N4)-methyltransferase
VTLQKQKQEKMHQNPHDISHQPVMLAEVIQYLNPQKGDSYLDVTAGYGGHAREILDLTQNYKESVLVDRDLAAVTELRRSFKGKGVKLMRQDFLGASRSLLNANRHFDLIMADLGVSSPHLNEVSRGFSFSVTGPLDMRMDQGQGLTAWDIVNKSSEAELADILWRYGEEPRFRKIAGLIVRNRPLETTADLAAIARQAWPGHSRSHPASRTFMAIRIAVNAELDQLSQTLPIWLKLLNRGGRIAVISFHSLEDRIIKQIFASESGDRYDASLTLLTKHPVAPDPHETANNPRARSAKLRAAVKQK